MPYNLSAKPPIMAYGAGLGWRLCNFATMIAVAANKSLFVALLICASVSSVEACVPVLYFHPEVSNTCRLTSARKRLELPPVLVLVIREPCLGSPGVGL